MLVYSENGLVDPWLTAQIIVEATDLLEPLVAVQPIYMHPYAAAKMVSTIAHVYGRRTQLNMVAGGFRNDLSALGDDTPHDERYARLVAYSELVRDLAGGSSPITREGQYYEVRELRLKPPVPPDLRPKFMVSGSSPAGLAAARALGATAVRYPQPTSAEEDFEPPADMRCGIRVGIIAREDGEEAWRIAHERFPENRAGQITHRLAVSVSDSHWYNQLSQLAAQEAARNTAYWLGPFENYATFCPYLVGDYATVARELAGYFRRGFDTVILDIPPSQEDLEHSAIALQAATQVSP
jgi:alkanesulfonate monooxygenase